MKILMITAVLLSIAYDASTCNEYTNSIVINEFMAENQTAFADINGQYSDWIELFNYGEKDINLSGFYLSDDLEQLDKVKLNPMIIKAGAYQIIWASGNDSLQDHVDFKLNKTGEAIYLTLPDGQTILSSVIYGQQFPDMSMSNVDGHWLYTPNPSPKAKNIHFGAYNGISENLKILFDKDKDGIKCSIHQTNNDDIIYTIDGTMPSDTNGWIYTEPFYIAPPYIVRAIQVGPKIITIGESTANFIELDSFDLPIISIITDPKNLWDAEIGLFVEGNHNNYNNRTEDWKRPASIQYIKSGKTVAHYNVDLKIYGAGTRRRPKKSVSILATGKMNDHFFNSNNVDNIDGFVLRACYTDASKYKNEIVYGVNEIMGKKALTQELYPCEVFINGAYWGVYNLMERKNKQFIENHGQYKVKDILTANIAQINALKGSAHELVSLFDSLSEMDINSIEAYNLINKSIDIESFNDFWIQELYPVKSDRHNNKFWRATSKNAKWEFMCYDFDVGFMRKNSKNIITAFQNQTPVGINFFGFLMQNEILRLEFLERLCDFINFGYTIENVSLILENFEQHTNQAFSRDYARWAAEWPSSLNNGAHQMNIIKAFVISRNEQIKSIISNELGLKDQVIISNKAPEKGDLWVNGFLVTGEVVYFSGMKIHYSIRPKKDFRFNGWSNTINNRNVVGILELDKHDHIFPMFH